MIHIFGRLIQSLKILTDEASTTEDGNLFHVSTADSLTEEPLSQVQPTSLNLYFQSMTTQTISTAIIQLKEVFHIHLADSLRYMIDPNQIAFSVTKDDVCNQWRSQEGRIET